MKRKRYTEEQIGFVLRQAETETPTDLASFILLHFYKRDFAKNKEKIRKAHFNAKKFLQDTVKNLGRGDDLGTVLASLKGVTRKGQTRRKEKG